MQFVLTAPMIITSRLAPGVKVGDTTVTVEPRTFDGTRYGCAYYIDTPSGTPASGEDLFVALVGDETPERDLPRKGMSALLDVLSTLAEEAAGDGTISHGSTDPAVVWAHQHADAIQALRLELDPCAHSWVAGMMYVHEEDLDTVYAARAARGETIECENCDQVYRPAQ
jgi:hypothetical protein